MKGVDDPVVAPAVEDLGIVRRGEVAVKDKKILYVGAKDGGSYVVGPQTMIIDAEGKVVCPGFVDSHTHAVFAGTREDEFLMRQRGKSYAEIQATGGGIVRTVRATRMTSEEKLRESLKRNIFKLSRYGSTTAEIKSGYGLNTEEEIKLLRVIKEVALETDILIVPTLLGAHVIPPEYIARHHKYVELVARDMVPMVHENHLAVFVDVYVDQGAFTIEEARDILRAARDHDMPRKIHADEMADDRGAELAAEMGCVSADHLIWTSEKGMKAMAKEGVVATLMPGTVLSLGHTRFADARAFIEHGVPVALATDYNPGTCMCPNMLLIMALG
jgi:imidazolonepropionase